ncbi:MerR family transcriptional regulator [Bacillus weihaiensis]|uniref:HTH merR-type domain-containing protein n=1 Tax=Bacillus weihaiensis TaxID=1547283 RepID=A0A1L3MS52_9BACI|nr:MerR family transcriptional regulator [Bacillus weihaiensis]APH05163.1 hypothetical protein A9C19_10610 [Bacillus weihaiensis]
MDPHLYSIGEFSKMTMTTIRTLHYYDEVGILTPTFVNEKGRRFYSEEALITLQKIISLKFLGFSLEDIKKLIRTQNWDLKLSLEEQLKQMKEKKAQIEKMITTLDHAIYLMKDNKEINSSIFVTLIHTLQNEEAQKNWFQTIFKEEQVTKMFSHSDKKQKDIEKAFLELTTEFKRFYRVNPQSDEVQNLITKYVQLTEEVTGMELSELVKEIPDEVEEDPWLFPSPFSKEEETWVSEAFDIYLKKKGVKQNGSFTGKK